MLSMNTNTQALVVDNDPNPLPAKVHSFLCVKKGERALQEAGVGLELSVEERTTD